MKFLNRNKNKAVKSRRQTEMDMSQSYCYTDFQQPRPYVYNNKQYVIYPIFATRRLSPMSNRNLLKMGSQSPELVPVEAGSTIGWRTENGQISNGAYGNINTVILDGGSLSYGSYGGDSIIEGQVEGFSAVVNGHVGCNAKVLDGSAVVNSYVDGNSCVERSCVQSSTLTEDANVQDSFVADSFIGGKSRVIASEVLDHSSIDGNSLVSDDSVCERASLNNSTVRRHSRALHSELPGCYLDHSKVAHSHGRDVNFYDCTNVERTLLTFGQTLRRQTVVKGAFQPPQQLSQVLPSESRDVSREYEQLPSFD